MYREPAARRRAVHAKEPAKGGKVGISVFDDDELKVDVDPMGETRISAGVAEMETVGSGSGLLDLTQESDDTSLGAELLDVISPTDETQAETAVADDAVVATVTDPLSHTTTFTRNATGDVTTWSPTPTTMPIDAAIIPSVINPSAYEAARRRSPPAWWTPLTQRCSRSACAPPGRSRSTPTWNRDDIRRSSGSVSRRGTRPGT